MQNRNLILSLVAVFMLAIFVFSQTSNFAKAQFNPADSTFPPFGGKIIIKMPITTQPPPNSAVICPSHTLILTTTGSRFGVVAGRLYDYRNNFTPGVKVLGRRTNVIVPTCVGAIGVFWPVYLLLYMGTSQF